jgi:hypothetical protein
MTMRALVLLPVLLALPAAAQEAPSAHSFAFIAGANRGGPQQQDLRYAEEDARRLAEVITSLGRFPARNVQLLTAPTRAQFLAGLDRLAREVGQARGGGAQVQVLFYYSGHARSDAISLGAEELPLHELRERLLALPATVTIAALDACQSGAFSRIKGVESTADFSFNSVNRLTNAGIAVMASSSATELSQESEQLRSSYFTHHLLVGLRGAGDADRDGRVTLFEAYRYAYNRTLVDTAATAVGSQHATLELGLRGKGEVVLTYPAEAGSKLTLASSLTGQVLVHREPGDSVVAEIHKAAGEPLAIALPAGHYVALYRRDRDIRRCSLALAERGTTPLEVASCPQVETFELASKGGDGLAVPRWGIELGLGLSKPVEDRYRERLKDFGFHERLDGAMPRLEVAGVHALGRHSQVGAELSLLDDRLYRREGKSELIDEDQSFRWTTGGLGAFGRLGVPLWRFFLYGQLGAGLSLGVTTYKEVRSDGGAVLSTTHDTFLGYWLKAGGGVSLMPWRHVGFFVQMHEVYAPTVKNLVGDHHDSGGLNLILGLRGAP